MKLKILAVLILIAIPISLPLLNSGLFTIHDDQQIARLFLLDEALRAGQFPIRWVSSLGFGFGYPLFNFYPPFIYYFAEIFHLLGFGFINSIKLLIFSSILLSGMSMYILSRELFGRLPALVSAIFYLYLPYRAVQIYIRGSLAESFTFVWLPLILWAFYKIYKTNNPQYGLFAGLFLSLLMLTHNLIFLAFFLFLPIYILFLFLKSANKKVFITGTLLSAIFSIGLSAFFWMPSLLEKKFTLVDKIFLATDFRDHFVYISQLWNSSWGFAGSAKGLEDGISFKISKIHIIVSALSIFLASAHIYINKFTNYLKFKSGYTVIIGVLFVFSAFMTTNYSSFIWDIIDPLKYIQFPWRLLTFTGLFASILAGAAFNLLRFPILKIVAAIILVFVVVSFNYKLFQPQAYREELTDDYATQKNLISGEISQQSFDYLPQGLTLEQNAITSKKLNLNNFLSKNFITLEKGNAIFSTLNIKPHEVTFVANARKKSAIKLDIFNFPGWQVYIDGEKTPVYDNNKLKLISFEIPGGIHDIQAVFTNTYVRSLANAVSIISTIIFLVLTLLLWRKRAKI